MFSVHIRVLIITIDKDNRLDIEVIEEREVCLTNNIATLFLTNLYFKIILKNIKNKNSMVLKKILNNSLYFRKYTKYI